MGTIKSYTDLSQSEKLAEILPIETADMYYHNRTDIPNNYPVPIEWKLNNPLLSQETPCWSLAALLELIPDIIEDYVLRIDKVDSEYFIWYDKIGEGWSDNMGHPSSKNFIDAVFEMVVWLKENKKI